ncbi:hypothetical protein FHS43_000084 [Streptosporangium becharense]|uniref:DUF3592 domain-containing protein n=1 Tax=Streptosporangium becharense TaxID=1816182 RepID=A0A7W9IG64_9ACTN|nr:DUF3592 domain-containing protein [Streptosporangium becharense]MBB2908838.1 hypothetical protein [Streptosporangium becharense]MBB5820144.1 hypothetical protein [Streptosporangium becharense]
MDVNTVPWFGILFGAVFAVSGVRMLTAARYLRRHGVRVPGVVVGLRRSSGNDGVFYPTMQFQTVQGFVVETESDLGSNPAPARPGQQVMVVYDPERPQRARLDGVGGRGVLHGVLFLTIGVIILVVCLIVGVSSLL